MNGIVVAVVITIVFYSTGFVTLGNPAMLFA